VVEPNDFDPQLNDITVIVVTYNSAHCVPFLAKNLTRFARVIISDNASGDGTVEAVRKLLPQAKLLPHAHNLGFGAANNRALSLVKTPWAILLNPDCEISASQANALKQTSEKYPEAAIVAPQLLRRDGSLELSYRWPSGLWSSNGPAAQGPCSVGFVCGAAMLVRMARCDGVGFFDENFFLYYEDEDWCQRLFEQRRSIVLEPAVQLVHAARGSVRGTHPLRAEYSRGYHHAQSKIIFANKHGGARRARKLYWRTLLLAILSLPLRMLVPIPKHVARHWGRIMGLWRHRLG
jgi:N-acetylglucosaminyl-diphospho-decaprenol L-rhamnosyltransferase